MNGPSLRRLVPILLLACIVPGCAAVANGPGIYQRTTPKTVADTLEDVEFAVTERNFRVVGRLHVGQGIRERDGTAFPDHEVVLFCNLGLARQMIELDPAFINYCPGRIAVRDAGGETIISAPLLPPVTSGVPAMEALVARMNQLIQEIVDESSLQWARHER